MIASLATFSKAERNTHRDRAKDAANDPDAKKSVLLIEPQRLFARSRFRFPAFVGGFGSGKTKAGIYRALSLKSQCIGQDVAYYLPTYPLINDIAFPRFCSELDDLGVDYKLNKTAGLSHIHIPGWGGQIKLRSMDQPERIVGYEVAHSILDELDTLPTAKAADVWVKVLARNRQKCQIGNTVGVATTPEGFRFVWQRWVRDKTPDYRVYRARTMDNAANLPAGYIDSMKGSYPAALLAAYLDGEFVNLTSGSVYHAFNRERCNTAATIQPNEALHIGMDFNVGKMAAVIHVIRSEEVIVAPWGKEGPQRVIKTLAMALEERVRVFDTPAMIALLLRDFPGRQIIVYPDASGGGRRSVQASSSDLALLKQAGFRVCVNLTNPAVKDRVLSMNKMFETKNYLVNSARCPEYTESLEKQAYDKNGEPDKSGDLDHAPDAGGYFIAYKFPIIRRVAGISTFVA